MKNKLFLILSVFSASQAVKPLTLEQEFEIWYYALADKQLSKVAKIIEEINPKAVDPYYKPIRKGWPTTLFYAIEIHDKKLIQELIYAGADINYFGGVYTPFTLAIAHNYPDIVELLLKKGANANLIPTYTYSYKDEEYDDGRTITITNYGQTPLEVAASFGNLNIAKILFKHGANATLHSRATSPLLQASTAAPIVAKGKFEEAGGQGDEWKEPLNQLIELLIQKGANPNKIVNDQLPLVALTKNGYIDGIKILLAQGANPTKNDTTYQPENALNVAFHTWGHDSEIYKLLESYNTGGSA